LKWFWPSVRCIHLGPLQGLAKPATPLVASDICFANIAILGPPWHSFYVWNEVVFSFFLRFILYLHLHATSYCYNCWLTVRSLSYSSPECGRSDCNWPHSYCWSTNYPHHYRCLYSRYSDIMEYAHCENHIITFQGTHRSILVAFAFLPHWTDVLQQLLTVGLHEFSHAIVGCCTCAKIDSIEIDPDEGGVTRMVRSKLSFVEFSLHFIA
jgi:hypothetical protein